MRLELKILAILFLLAGIYAGVTLLPGRQTDENQRAPEGLVLARGNRALEPLAPKYEGWVRTEKDETDNQLRELRCPHGYQDPGIRSKDEDLIHFGPNTTPLTTPNNFLQKHFCHWCEPSHNTYLNGTFMSLANPNTDTY